MRWCIRMRAVAVGVALGGLLIPTGCLQGQSTSSATVTNAQAIDIGLEEGNVLRGYVVDNAGNAAGHVSVLLFSGNELTASGLSDAQGRFAIANLRGGVYQLAAGDQVSFIRCWAPHTSPPTAKQSVLLQVENVQRAQISPASCALANPWVIAGIVAAAIAIPVALKANSDDRDNGS